MLCRREMAGHSRSEGRALSFHGLDRHNAAHRFHALPERWTDRGPSLRSELIVEVRVRTDCSKIESSFDFGMPMPLSRISTRGWVLDQSASTRTARAGFEGSQYLDGVGEQVHDHQFHAARVGGKRGQPGFDVEGDATAMAMSLSWPATS